MTNSLKLILTLHVFTFIMLRSEAQETTTFYDSQWKKCDASEARFYSVVKKTDSGWLRRDYYISTRNLQMTGLYKDSLCKIKHGVFMYFYANDGLESRGNYENGKESGIHIRYHYNGVMADSSNYIDGHLAGTNLGWHSNGFLSDSVDVKNDSIRVEVRWFDNGGISEYGYYLNGKKHGKWNYFHKTGGPAAVELNDHGKVISAEFFNEDGSVQTDTSLTHRVATFKKGIAYWTNYLTNKIYWPQEYRITNSNTATVVTKFVIDEDGKISEYFISVPFHRLLDNIAIDAIKQSPSWKPEIDHNRRVKAYRIQPMTFTQE